MEPIRTTKTARLRRLEMYREDLDEFVAFFNKSCRSVTISDKKNRYDSLDEMQSHNGVRIKDLDIRGDDPAIHFLLNQKEAVQGSSTPAIFNELRTEEITAEADVLFFRIREFLEERQRPLVRVPFVGIAVISFILTVCTLVRNVQPSHVPVWSIVFFAVTILAIIPALYNDNLLTLEKRANSPTFWVRNREDFLKHLVTASMSAVIGGIIGWLIGHSQK